MTGLVVRALGWGLWISLLAGAAAGTAILPIVYTPFGAIVGLALGVVPTILTTAVVAAYALNHQPRADAAAFYADLTRLFRWVRNLLIVVGAAVLAGGIWGQLTQDGSADENSIGGMVIYTLWLGVGPWVAASLVVWRLLPRAARSLTRTFVQDVAQGSPGPGDSQVGGPLGRVIPEGAS